MDGSWFYGRGERTKIYGCTSAGYDLQHIHEIQTKLSKIRNDILRRDGRLRERSVTFVRLSGSTEREEEGEGTGSRAHRSTETKWRFSSFVLRLRDRTADLRSDNLQHNTAVVGGWREEEELTRGTETLLGFQLLDHQLDLKFGLRENVSQSPKPKFLRP
ncbi:hypothetical protein CRG98_007259 [Punica granatum]|uniref:Uncharacterized protein n=1 Tax=Punica granatum TaxID=22663 RepID=A0A2I0KVA7_PUNGR|nr:hypothetical protein CRG98_007259 [Punica granatum]